MKPSHFVAVCLLLTASCSVASAQGKRKHSNPQKKSDLRRVLIVVDERLSAARVAPSVFAAPIRRLRRGRVFASGVSKSADGLVFCKVALSSRTTGWVQSEAFVVRGRLGEDVRLFRLTLASDGFDQIDRARIFLEAFPDSPMRPAMLLLLGDLIEEVAAKLSRDLERRLSKSEMSASGAPLRSFYLGNVALDRYLRLGLGFVFDESSMRLHYDGRAWQEIVKKFPTHPQAVEARKRISLNSDR